MLIVFDDIIADMLIVTNSPPNNSNTNPIVIELLIKGRKLHISLVFITQPYFAVPKNIRLNSTHHSVMKNLNKRELQKILYNYSSDIDFQEFLNRYKNIYCKIIFAFSCVFYSYKVQLIEGLSKID